MRFLTLSSSKVLDFDLFLNLTFELDFLRLLLVVELRNSRGFDLLQVALDEILQKQSLYLFLILRDWVL